MVRVNFALPWGGPYWTFGRSIQYQVNFYFLNQRRIIVFVCRMAPKLLEMDTLIEQIYLLLKRHNNETGAQTLLVICSDHGMNEVNNIPSSLRLPSYVYSFKVGNHGGTSPGEVGAVMVFLSPLLEKNPMFSEIKEGKILTQQYDLIIMVLFAVAQVDIVPTLALLFGLPIPKNNMGTLISDLFSSLPGTLYQFFVRHCNFLPVEEYLRALELNSLQRFELMKSSSLFWIKGGPSKLVDETVQLYVFLSLYFALCSWYYS